MARAPTSAKSWWIVVRGGIRNAAQDVVEADHRHLVRHLPTGLVQRAQHTERHLVVAREDRRHAAVGRDQATHAS